jgi:phenylacetate-CoA ligase
MRILGRADDMLIIRGVNVFPSQIEHVLMQLPEVGEHYMIIVDRREDGLDELTVQVELSESAEIDTTGEILKLEKRIADMLKSVLNVWAKVEVVNPGTLQRFEGKAKRVIDKRKI